MNVSDGDEDPNQPAPRQHHRAQYKFSAEEVRVIRECNRDSFYQRCIPIGMALGLSTYYGVKSGFLRASPRFGAFPKVSVAVVVGYFAGKFSYQSKCAEKLMQLPNSQIGEILRKKKQGTFQESSDSGFGPGMSLGPFSGISSSNTYSDIGPGSGLDLDTSRPQVDGLDDSQRPSLDNPIYEEEMPPVQKSSTTYEELRKKNREEYQQRRTVNYRESYKPSGAPTTSSPPPPSADGPKNKYGDVWE